MNDRRTSGELTRTTFAVLFICALIVASLWILQPFLPAFVWATTVVVATWPLLLRVERHCGQRRAPAVAIMTLMVALVLVAPLSLAVGTLVEHADQIVDWLRSLSTLKAAKPPPWLGELPFVGHKAEQVWAQIGTFGTAELAAKAAPYVGNLTQWFVKEVGSFGLLFVQFLLIIALSAILYSSGERAAAVVRRFGRRLAGESGDHAVQLAGQAVRAVALGVGITALVQSLLGGIGLAISGVPLVPVLTALMLMLCIAQLGPGFVLVPAVLWLYWNDSTVLGTFLLVWTLIVISLDNFLRPLLIKKGANLPLLLILAGVVGGLLAFGLVGIFVGPVVLAIAYTLLNAWMDDDSAPAETLSGVPPEKPGPAERGGDT